MAGTPNFKIYLKETSRPDWDAGSLNWTDAIDSATLVYNGNPVSILGSTTGWKGFAINGTTGFTFSGTYNLAVMVEYTNATASAAIKWSYNYTAPCISTGNSYTTKYSNNITGVLPTTLDLSNYRVPYMAFDVATTGTCATATGFPTTGTITATPNTFCLSGNVNLNFSSTPTIATTLSGIFYKWQYLVGAVWTNLATTAAPYYTANNISASTSFRCRVFCGTTSLFTTSAVPITINNPGNDATVTNGVRCGPGTVVLSATSANPNAEINWYSAITGGTSLGTGSSFTTPVINTTTSYYVSFKEGTCEAPRKLITAKVNPLPPVYLGPDVKICTDDTASAILDAGTFLSPVTYLWDNGSTLQTRMVTQSGNYSVNVKDTNNCIGTDNIKVDIDLKPVVDLGNDTNICVLGSIVLNAGSNVNSYQWNTGNLTNQITVTSPGTYYVKVTNPKDCYNLDTINITVSGQFPKIDNIIVKNDGNNTFEFSVDNPQFVISYDWDFGDGSTHSDEQAPTHIYIQPGDYEITLTLKSTCGSRTYTKYSSVVGIKQFEISNDALLITPNPSHGNVTITNRTDAIKMEQILIYNIMGQLVYQQKADNATFHKLNIENLPGGNYIIKIVSDKGFIVRKLQLY